MSASERAILERLQSRRQELDARAREMDIRESLLKAAEKRVESHVEELKGVELQISTATEQKSEAEAARFKGIITMYEAMKPKDAAKVFDRLEMPVLFQIASQIAPRKMSDILGLMSPEAAERLTVEMARRASPDKSASAELPKIEGKMLPQKPTLTRDSRTSHRRAIGRRRRAMLIARSLLGHAQPGDRSKDLRECCGDIARLREHEEVARSAGAGGQYG